MVRPRRPGSDLIAATSALAEREEILLLGRVTFEAFRGYWPDHADDGTGISAELDQVRKVVVSSTMTDPQWQNSEVLGPDWLDQVRALKAEDGDGQVVVTGSISICHALFEAGLVDEINLFVFPVVQGRGRGLVPEGMELDLDLIRSRTFDSGAVLLGYRTR